MSSNSGTSGRRGGSWRRSSAGTCASGRPAAGQGPPAFRLALDELETQFVRADYAAPTAVTALAKRLTSVLSRAPVAHRDENIDHELLKERRCRCLETI